MTVKECASSSSSSSSIFTSYPEYATTSALDDLRQSQYGYLDEQKHVYLDYTGAGLAARAQLAAHSHRLANLTCGNPHSINPTSQLSDKLIAETRRSVLAFLGADPAEYVVIFTANATAAARLVGEAYPFHRGSRLVMTADNHNSINGLRCFAERAKARTVYVPIRPADLRVESAAVAEALDYSPRTTCLLPFRRRGRGTGSKDSEKRGLFAYPAQSNFSGVRHPLSWVRLAQERGYDVLLDAAAFLPTAPLDLSVVHPEFVLVSWYKLFGFPTGVGCLVARRDALVRLERPWFSGGTVKAVAVGVPWHSMADWEAAFEDGTVNFLSIPDVRTGLAWFSKVGVGTIATRVRCLTGWFVKRLRGMHHSDGAPLVRIYGPLSTENRGGTVALNFVDARGRVIDQSVIVEEAAVAEISLRTGCFCNPGAALAAMDVERSSLEKLPRSAARSLEDFAHVLGLPSFGAVRVSFGVASTVGDVDAFMRFAATFRDRVSSPTDTTKRG